MKILVANIGSTSFKWKLFVFEGEKAQLVHRGAIENVRDYGAAVKSAFDSIARDGHFTSEADLSAIGFKVVHALRHTGCVLLDEEVLEDMREASILAPAHNPPYIAAIKQIAERFPSTPLIGLFETSFYQWIPDWARYYAVPYEWVGLGVRRWGFHGASHKYISERSAELLGRIDIRDRVYRLYKDGPGREPEGPPLRIISCHLGGSSSVTGLRNGIPIGNSMGLSPQSGLPQNNRVGDLDVFAIPLLLQSSGLTMDELATKLARGSGLMGLSGVSNDIREILKAAEQGNSRARLAVELFVHEVRRWLATYWLELGGVEAVIFTGGIGENQPCIRASVCEGLWELGLELDPEKNELTLAGKEGFIHSERSRVKVAVIPTNEELIVAREVKGFLEKRKSESN